MTDRETLISMGFTPERVDWALRDTPASADLQIRMDHILEHEAQTVPEPQIVQVTQKYGPPSHPPPQNVQLQAPPLPPRSQSPAPLIHSMDSMSINQKTKLQAPSISPSFPFPKPPTRSMGSHASSLESDAVQRYAAFLVEHKEHLKEARTDLMSATALHTVITKFLTEEGERWRNELGLPTPALEGSSSTPQRSHNISQSNQEDVPTAEQSVPVITVENIREQGEQEPTSDIYDPIAVYDSTRILLPPVESIQEIRVVTGYEEDEPVENAKKRALKIHSRMSEEVSNLRWSSGILDASPYDDAFNRRAEEHSTKLTELHLRGDWDAANRLEQEYSQHENSIRQQKNRADFQIYCREYLDPMTEKVHKALADLHPIYAEIKKYLEEDNWELDVVRAIAALEQVSETMELGMQTLAELEDERHRRELDLQRHIITNDKNRSDPFGDVSKLEKQHEFKILELKAHRTVQKVGRRAPFFALATRRIKEAIAWVDRDQELLQYHIRILLDTLHPTIPLEQEEYCANQGDTGPSRVPLPSKGLHNQIAWLQSLLWPVHAMTNDMRSVLRGIQRKQMGEKREDDLAQFAASEARSGKGDNPYFGSRSIIHDRCEKEDAETERLFEREREERSEAFDMFMAPVGEYMTSYKNRETLVLQKLAMNTTALEPVPPPSGNVSSGDGENPMAALSEMQNFILWQQQMQMRSDQHAMLCATISNMYSGLSSLV